jgi:hypothetical protein
LVTDAGEDRADLVLCTDAHQACSPDRTTCTGFHLADRLGMLHELGHAWLLQHGSQEDEVAFLQLNELDAWADGSVPWHQRGAEQAAETLAWGLLDEEIALVRVGDPSCDVASSGFEILTGEAPLRDCN